MVQKSVCIDLYLECVDRKIYDWEGVRKFAVNSQKYRTASDEEVYEVYTELHKNYGKGTE